MEIERIQIEERCDRCGILMATREGKEKKERDLAVRRKIKSRGGVLVDLGGKKVLSYNSLCHLCFAKIEKLITAMGKVDRTRGGKPRSNRTKRSVQGE